MRCLEDAKNNGNGLAGQWLRPSQLVGERSQNAAAKLHVQSHRSPQQLVKVESATENQLDIIHVHASYRENKKAIIKRVCRMVNVLIFEMVKRNERIDLVG